MAAEASISTKPTLIERLRDNDAGLTELHFEGTIKDFDDENYFQEFLKAMQENTTVTKVRITGDDGTWVCTSCEMKLCQLLKAFGSLPALKELEFSNAFAPIECLVEMLRVATKLESLRLLKFCNLGDYSSIAFCIFCDTLQSHPSLRHVKLEPEIETKTNYDEMGFDWGRGPTCNFSVGELLRALSKTPKLQYLHVRPYIRCSYDHWEIITGESFEAIFGCTTLKELSLDFRGSYRAFVNSQNRERLSRALNSSSLKTLCYRDDGGHVGIAIANALEENNCLETVHIVQRRSNKSAETRVELASAISRAVAVNTNLKELHVLLGKNQDSGTCDTEPIARALKINSTLKVFDLSDNQLCKAAFAAFADALKVNSTLESLDLRDNVEGKRAMFRESLETNHTLVSLETGTSYWDDYYEHEDYEPDYFTERDAVVDFYLRLNRAGRGKLLKSMKQADWLDALIEVAATGGCTDKVGYESDEDDYFDEDDEYAAMDSDVACTYYFLRANPMQFFSNSPRASPLKSDPSPRHMKSTACVEMEVVNSSSDYTAVEGSTGSKPETVTSSSPKKEVKKRKRRQR